jgi:DNA-binding beta-propeller fold protein YncE
MSFRLLGALAALVACAGCSSCGGNSQSARDAHSAEVFDASGVESDAGISAEEVFASFSTIETIAGLGQIEKKGVSGWKPEYEGGLATAAELSRPHMTVADAAGNLYVADKDAHAVRKISPAGVITTLAGTGVPGDDGDGVATERRLSSPNGLWVHGNGTAYVLDMGNAKVRRVDAQGQMSTLFEVPSGLGTGRGLWVADDESLAYAAAGSSLKRWTPGQGVTTVAAGFASLGNLAVLPSGKILVTDRLAHRVYRVDPDTGSKTPVAGNGTTAGGGDGSTALSTGLNEVRGVWPHPRGGYFLATHKGGQVWFVDSAGIIHLFVDGDSDDTHAGDGQPFGEGKKISEPRGISMDAAGNLIITEHDAGFVRLVRATVARSSRDRE